MDRIWTQCARPPQPRPGSFRAGNARASALARAWRVWSDPAKVIAMYRACAVLNDLGPEKYVVDHIVPLQGSRVSGLHTHDNLQVITIEENRAKGHWWWPQMWPIEDEAQHADEIGQAFHIVKFEAERFIM